MITCKVCNQIICNNEKEWKKAGGIGVDIGKRKEVKLVDICKECAKKIAEELIDSI